MAFDMHPMYGPLSGDVTTPGPSTDGLSVPATISAAGIAAVLATVSRIKIAETILGSDQATVSLSSIPQIYRNLVLTMTVRNDNAAAGATDGYIQFNGDTAANYSRGYIAWPGVNNFGTNLSVAKAPAFYALNNGEASGLATTVTITIYDYARTVWKKNATGQATMPMAGVFLGNSLSFHWASTAAINAILIGMTDSSKLLTGSVFSLYGER